MGEHTRLVGHAYKAGETIQALTEGYQVTRVTNVDHLTKFVLAGNPLRHGEDLDTLSSLTPEQKRAVFAAFDELGATYLRPVLDKLNASLSYDELKILRVLYLTSRAE